MKLGVYLFSQSNFNPDKRFDKLVERVRYYDEIGVDSIWISDGLTGGADPALYPHYETLSLISALSQYSRNLHFGTLVSPHSIRPVSLFAKSMMTLDHITQGRVIAGVGLGRNFQGQNRIGKEDLSLKEQFDEFEEYVKALKSLFRGEKVTSSDLNLSDYPPNPLTYSDNGPKLLIGGGGEKRTLKQVARYADMSNIWGPNDVLERKLGILASWCDNVGRTYSEIENTTMRAIVTGKNDEEIKQDVDWYMNRFSELGRGQPTMDDFRKDRFYGSIDQIVDQINYVKDLGISHLILTINTENTRNNLGQLIDRIKS